MEGVEGKEGLFRLSYFQTDVLFNIIYIMRTPAASGHNWTSSMTMRI